MGAFSSTRSSLRGGKYSLLFALVALGAFLVAWGDGRGVFAQRIVALLPPPDDTYFFPFLEIFLRRSLPRYQVVTLSPGGSIPPFEELVVVAFSEDLGSFLVPPSEGNVSCVLLGNGGETPYPLLGRVVFSWESVKESLQQELSGEKQGFLFVGERIHPLFPFLETLLGRGCIGRDVHEESVVVVGQASLVQPFLKKKNERSFLLLVLEASTEMLFALQEGRIDFLVDTKPSCVAQCITQILEEKEQGDPFTSPRCCTVMPLLVTRETIASADAYEVVRRCLSCH